MRDRIHISEHTASLIQRAGHEDWVTPREEIISAKGKGRMNTYWLNRRAVRVSSKTNLVAYSRGLDDGYERRIRRCIDWNTELVLELLKKVVAHRNAVSCSFSTISSSATVDLKNLARTIGDGALVVDEVANIIEMPEPDYRAGTVKPESVMLPRKVVVQCRKYITLIASLYNRNPFHNFEVRAFLKVFLLVCLRALITQHY